jgi:hypothetical protein
MDRELQEALEAAQGLAATPANFDRVIRKVSPEAARWAFAQWELRQRAKSKFSRASEMLFTREALEQATSEGLAQFHASRFPKGVLVADLTTGIGGDLIALAQRGPAIGFETDAARAQLAEENLAAYDLTAEVRVESSLAKPWSWQYAFADPARRVEGRRTIDPSEFAPDPATLAQRFAALKLGILKLTTLLSDAFLESLGPELIFASYQDECREALVSCGTEAGAGRWAIHVESGERIEAGGEPPVIEQPGEFFFDADPAAIRGHCLGSLCRTMELQGLGDSRGYLTGNAAHRSPWFRSFRVLYHGKADLSATRKALVELGAATPEWKQRHAGEDLDRLRKTVRLDGNRQVSVAIWPVGRSLRHTILEPLV